MRGIGAQRQFWGTGNVGNDDFDFGQQGNKAIQPEQDRTNKMIRAHAEDADQPKTQISLGIHPVWSESSLCTQWVATDQRFLRADRELWSDRVDAQVDLSLHLAGHFVGFAVRRLNLFQGIKGIDSPARERVSCIPLKWWSAQKTGTVGLAEMQIHFLGLRTIFTRAGSLSRFWIRAMKKIQGFQARCQPRQL